MKKIDGLTFLEYLKERILLLDGATGTFLLKNGMKPGVCPESFALENPHLIIELQRGYLQAGSKVLSSATFGANAAKLGEFGLSGRVGEYNMRLAELTADIAGNRAFVGGNVGTTGRFLRPLGDLSFDDAVAVYKEQIKALEDGGADFILIETMIDIQEARAAVIAAKECCSLPVVASMTFERDGRTLTGTSPAAAAITLISAGADAVGLNCSTGPAEMVPLVKSIKEVSSVPLYVKPNAGLPRIENGAARFDLPPGEFRKYVKPLCEAGANLIGGCCGTDPSYIKAVAEEIEGLKPIPWRGALPPALTSVSDAVYFGAGFRVIGERINPTGKPKLKESLKNADYYEALDLALEQKESGAHILDINTGTPETDEKKAMEGVIETVAMKSKLPLSIDSSKPEVIERALRVCPGRALVNSVSAKSESLERLLPVVKRYKAMFILLPVGDEGIPHDSKGRIGVIEKAFARIEAEGISKEDILVDGLVMAVSADAGAAAETLKTLEWCSANGFKTVLGISNGSFGLPQRWLLNSAYLVMAIEKGLSAAIMNPGENLICDIYHAAEALTGRDEGFARYMSRFAQASGGNAQPAASSVEDAVLNGKKNVIASLVEKEIASGVKPNEVIDNMLIPALKKAGDLYEQKAFFLPHLIYSAEAARAAFEYLEKQYPASQDAKKKVVIATVRGDVHDIGKNLVAMLLRNHGFNVTDLGKDVPAETIVGEAQKLDADIIGLSALLTTTAAEMGEVIRLARDKGLRAKIMVGGAVVTEKYARSIGADAYAADAAGAVREARRLTETTE